MRLLYFCVIIIAPFITRAYLTTSRATRRRLWNLPSRWARSSACSASLQKVESNASSPILENSNTERDSAITILMAESRSLMAESRSLMAESRKQTVESESRTQALVLASQTGSTASESRIQALLLASQTQWQTQMSASQAQWQTQMSASQAQWKLDLAESQRVWQTQVSASENRSLALLLASEARSESRTESLFAKLDQRFDRASKVGTAMMIFWAIFAAGIGSKDSAPFMLASKLWSAHIHWASLPVPVLMICGGVFRNSQNLRLFCKTNAMQFLMEMKKLGTSSFVFLFGNTSSAILPVPVEGFVTKL